jgi:hypothetical protein
MPDTGPCREIFITETQERRVGFPFERYSQIDEWRKPTYEPGGKKLYLTVRESAVSRTSPFDKAAQSGPCAARISFGEHGIQV